MPRTTYAEVVHQPVTTHDDPGDTIASARPSAYEHALVALAQVLASPLSDVAEHFSRLLTDFVPHSALIIVDEDDVGRPKKQYGRRDIVTGVTMSELEAARAGVNTSALRRETAVIAGTARPVIAAVARTGALVLLTDAAQTGSDPLVLDLWQILALRIQQHASEASPTYLLESRAAASARVEAINELADRHTATLESLLAVLRGTGLNDRAARHTATSLAAAALVHMRTDTDRVRTFTEEPVSTAFERLQDDLRPLVRYRDIDVQFIEPPVDGRALPSEVAHGARAVVRGAVLALVDQSNIRRVRVKWDCDGKNLLIDVRDDGPGELTVESAQLQSLRQRVIALNGQLSLVATEGWGSQMSVVLPLDPPLIHGADASTWNLGKRETEVLGYLATGRRNRSIATALGISENTVKFHVSKIFRKLGVSSRAEAAALALERHIPHPQR